VLGGYILLFPGRRVHVWIFITIIAVPAILAVGLWFLMQVLNGLGTLGGEESAGIAYAAHIGGFVAGLVLVKVFARRVVKKAPVRRSLF
jgi:membrane associated rhomboid family serine protease